MNSDYLYFDLETNVSKIWSYGLAEQFFFFKNIWIFASLGCAMCRHMMTHLPEPVSEQDIMEMFRFKEDFKIFKDFFAIYILATRTRTRTVKYHTMSSSSWSPLSRWTSSNSPILLISTLGSDGDQYFFLFPLFDNQRRVVSQKNKAVFGCGYANGNQQKNVLSCCGL